MIFTFEHAFTAGDRDFAELDKAIANCVEKQSIPQSVAAQLMIAFDELISNILNNRKVLSADAGETDPILKVQIETSPTRISALVADNGPEFDPLSLPAPETDQPVEDREFGGLGVHLVRNLMENVTYSRENGWNKLRFSKTFELG